MNESPSQWHWHELNTSNLEAASDFYAEIFNWGVENVDFDGQPYKMLLADGRPIGGIARAQPGEVPAWSVYISVVNCDAARQAVIDKGGTVNFGPVGIPGVGRIAACNDPLGAGFVIIEPEEGAG